MNANEPKPDDGLQNKTTSASDKSAKNEQDTNWVYFGVAATFVLLIVSLSLIFYSFSLSSTISEKETIIENQQNQIDKLQAQIEQNEEIFSILENRDVNLVVLSGLEANPEGYGKILWTPSQQRALLQVSNLPAVPNDKSYRLWFIKNNKPISVAAFSVDDKNDQFLTFVFPDNVAEQTSDSFAITLEPKDTTQPTGDMYLMSSNFELK